MESDTKSLAAVARGGTLALQSSPSGVHSSAYLACRRPAAAAAGWHGGSQGLAVPGPSDTPAAPLDTVGQRARVPAANILRKFSPSELLNRI